MSKNPYRDLPPVEELVDSINCGLPRPVLVDVARTALDNAREKLGRGEAADPMTEAQDLALVLERSSGIGVINASGVLLHTNLGRARWSQSAIDRAKVAAAANTNLEINLEDGQRGSRGSYVTTLLQRLTGAEDALVVNNNASAVFLALAAMSRGRSCLVARGELIEIGGSYRLPDVMEASGAQLVEVGTTNRSRLGDYQTALQLYDVGAVLKVHPSNYRVEGFTSEAGIAELSSLPGDAMVVHDIGSGLLDSEATWLPDWLVGEPGASQSLSSGADLVMFSGDKLLGGPQAGVIVGKAAAVDRLRSDALARALRVDAVTYAALAATLEAHLENRQTDIPFWAHALATYDDLSERAEKVASSVDGLVEPGHSAVGGGSAPGIKIPTPVVRLKGRDHHFNQLLAMPEPVLTRREHGDLVVDLRAVDTDQDNRLIENLAKCL